MNDDLALLAEYARHNSEEAFAALIMVLIVNHAGKRH
jgi:hypothetical protein